MIAVLDGELTVKWLDVRRQAVSRVGESKLPLILIQEEQSFEV